MHLKRVAILGGGNMGEAIARGIRDGGRGVLPISSGEIIFAEPDLTRHARLTAGGHCHAVPTASEALAALAAEGLVIVAVKPQIFPTLAQEVRGLIGTRLVISIMAGKSAEQVHAELGGQCRVVRVMPSLPMNIGRGMAAVCPGPGSTRTDVTLARDLFAAMGDCIEIDESLMDAFTALAASGPAYVAYLVEAMTQAGVSLGFTPEQAWQIVAQTVAGAASLIRDEPAGAEPVRARITSKGGTTAAAISVLESAQAREAIIRAITAARDRGRELRGG